VTMNETDIGTMIASIGIPYAYYSFDDDTAEAPPFICWYFPGDDDFKADNQNYTAIRPVTIELYTDEKDFELEKQVETVLKQNGLSFSRDETYISDERMFEVIYETEVIYNG